MKKTTLDREIIWVATQECTRRRETGRECPECFGHSPEGQLDADKRMLVAKNLVDINPPKIIITGGEPFLIQDLPNLVKYIAENNIRCSLSSTGDLITDENFEKVAPYITKST